MIFPSDGAATTALMGGHLDVAPVTAAFAASLLRSKQVRVLVVAAPQRLGVVLAAAVYCSAAQWTPLLSDL